MIPPGFMAAVRAESVRPTYCHRCLWRLRESRTADAPAWEWPHTCLRCRFTAGRICACGARFIATYGAQLTKRYCSEACRRLASKRRETERRGRDRQTCWCRHCHRDFIGRRADARFCSPRCRQAAYRQRYGSKGGRAGHPRIRNAGRAA